MNMTNTLSHLLPTALFSSRVLAFLRWSLRNNCEGRKLNKKFFVLFDHYQQLLLFPQIQYNVASIRKLNSFPELQEHCQNLCRVKEILQQQLHLKHLSGCHC